MNSGAESARTGGEYESSVDTGTRAVARGRTVSAAEVVEAIFLRCPHGGRLALGAFGASRLEAIYRLTERNAPCLAFWEASGFEHETDAKRFTWQVARPYPEPELVSLVRG